MASTHANQRGRPRIRAEGACRECGASIGATGEAMGDRLALRIRCADCGRITVVAADRGASGVMLDG